MKITGISKRAILKAVIRTAFLLIFVTISTNIHAQTYILNEDFSAATDSITPPTGWENNTVTGSAGDLWRFDNPGNRTMNFPIIGTFAIFDSEYYSGSGGAEQVDLVTPFLDCSINPHILLFFDHFFAGGRGGEGKVEIWDGSAWKLVDSFTDSTENPAKATYDISNWAGGNTATRLRFRWEGDSSMFWAIDNIKVLAPLNYDAGIVEITDPNMPFDEGTQDIKVSLRNYGYETITSTTIRWKVNGTEQTPYNWTGNLPYNSQIDDITIGSLNFPAGLLQNIQVWQESPNGQPDENPQNDSTDRSLAAAFCGSFTIGGIDGDFENFTEAITVLNEAGITCPVVFNVRDGVYQEQIEINAIPGSSELNTVTFQSESGDSSAVSLAMGSSALDYTLLLNNTSNINFNKIKIDRYSGGNYSVVMQDCNNISFKNCFLRHLNTIAIRAYDSYSISILNSYFHEKLYATDCQEISVENCQIHGSISFYNPNSKGHLFKNNSFYDNVHISAYGFPKATDIINNDFFNCHLETRGSNINEISGNRFLNLENENAIYCYSQGTSIKNNFISINGQSNATGIKISYAADSCNVLFNTINHTGTNTTGSRAIETTKYSTDSPTNLTIKNNIFNCANTGIPAYFDSDISTCDIDYNNYYCPNGNIGYYNGTTYSDLNTWGAAIIGDANSKNVNPFFSADSLPDPNQALLNASGIWFNSITIDIDSTIRNNPPDIGAKEFSPVAIDAGIDEFTAPQNPLQSSNQAVKVMLMNQGTENLNNAIIQWEINGESQNPVSWNGSLAYQQSEEIILSPNYNFNSSTIFNLKAWSEQPNSQNDVVPYNDTAYLNNLVAPLCGTYTIGGSDGDFENFTEAITVLNEAGITCPVVFNVRDGVYQEQIEINAIPGSSELNTVTFQSESGDSSAVSLAMGSSALDYTLLLNNTSNITFNKIKIDRYSGGNYSVVMQDCNNISFKNCFLRHLNTIAIRAYDSYSISILNSYFHEKLYATDCQEISVENCQIHGSISFYNPNSKGHLFKNNSFYDNVHISAYGFPKATDIINNDFFNCHLETRGSNINEISGNRFLNLENENAIYCYSQGTSIKNNFISINGQSNATGIKISYAADSCNVLFNTINHTGTNTTGSRAIETTKYSTDSPTNLTIKNNIFNCANTGIPAYFDSDISTCDIDYNNYYCPNGNIGYYNGTTYSDLNTWGAAIIGDANSKNVNPFFSADSLPDPNQALLNASGIWFNSITIDIDSTIRNNPPDIGAKEFSPVAIDAGIDEFTAPQNPLQSSNQAVKVMLMNQGTENLNNAIIQWEINGESQNPVSWNGSLAYQQSEEIILSPNYNFNSSTIFNLKAWSEQPNSQNDVVPYNDTAYLNNLVAPLCGTYTIGGSDGDFENFTEAITVLNEAGITCPVVFNVRDGVYQEQIEINAIPGSSELNTVTFQSESGDSSAVSLAMGSSALDYTLLLNNTSNITFNKIKIDRYSGGNYSVVMQDCNNISFKNCFLRHLNTIAIRAYDSYSISILNSYFHEKLYATDCQEISVENCQIHGSISFYNPNSKGHLFKNNSFYDNVHISAYGFPKATDIINNDFFNCHLETRGSNINEISGNRFLNLENENAIYCYSQGTSIKNNFISINGQSNATGIKISYAADSCNVLFNTINHTGTNTTGSRAIETTKYSTDSPTNLTIKNNIFNCANTGIPAYFDSDISTCDIDYNNYYCPNGNIGHYDGTTYNDLNTWGAAIIGDANSKNVNPFFSAEDNPLPYQRQLNGAGLPIGGITTDINGKLRNDQAPDIGAVEFMVDFGVNRLISPNLSCTHDGVDSVTVLLRQFGDIPFTDIKIAYQVNGGVIVQDTIEGSISNDLEYTFSEGIDISVDGEYNFKIWLIGVNDDNPNNDTLNETRYSKPSPEVSFSWSPECAGTEIQFNGSASVGGGHFIAGYEWIFDEQDTSTLQNPMYTFGTGGAYPVNFRAYSDAGCYADTTEMIQVWYKPLADYSVNNSCSNDTSYFTDNSLPMEGAITNWNWSFGDGGNAGTQDTKHKYGIAGDYESQLIVTNTNGCKDTLVQSVHVYEIPMADFSVDTVVVGQEAEFNDLSTSIEGNITAWFWDFDDGSYSAEQEPEHSYTAPGIYQVTLSVTTEFGCTHSYTGEAVVIDDIMAIFDADTVCFGTPTHFTDQSVHNGSSITAWNWDFGDGSSSTEQNPEHIFTSSGNHSVILSITNNYGSVDDTTINIVVAANPLADFSSDEACWESPTHFTDASSAGYGNISSWEWDFGSSQQNPEHTFGSFGTQNVRLVVTNTNGCKDTTYQDVTVKPSPLDVGLPAEYNQQILARYPFNGNANDMSGNNYDATVHGATLSSDRYGRENHAYLFDGISNYMVAPLNLNFHQEVSLTFWMQIESLPTTKAAIFSNEAASGGRIINILNDGRLEMIDPNGSSGNSVQQLQSGNWYHVCAIWTSGHNQLFINNQIEINEAASPGGLDDMPVLNIGRPGNGDDEYAHISLDEIQIYSRVLQPEEVAWFYNGRIGADAPDGLCSGETAEIKIFNAESGVNYQICDENNIPLTTAQNGPADTLCFNIADITSDTAFKIRAEMSNACERILDTVLNITVYPSPVSDFAQNSVCEETAMQFTDESSISGGAIINWNWDFGDGQTSTDQNPEFTFATSGDYDVELITYSNNACSDTITKSVHVFALPMADFLSDTACWGDSTAFTDFSMSNEGQIDQWNWNFGDPSSGSNNISSLQNPKHEYAVPGDYMAQLIVTDINGCSDTLEKNIPAGKLPQAFAGADTSVCENALLQLDGEVAEAGTWNWATTGDGIFTNSNDLSTTYQPGSNDIATGSFQIILNAAANAPCQGDASDTMDVQVIYLPFADAGNDTSICENASLMLNAMASDYQSILWTTLGDGSFDDAGSLATTYTPGANEIAALSSTIVLTAYPLAPCGDLYRDTLIISMDPLPEAHAGEDADMCSNATFPTAGWVEYSSGFEWTTSGDGSFDDPGSSMAIYMPGPNDIANGNVALSITAFGAAACPDTDTDEMTLSILPPPLSNAGADAVVCENAGITLDGSAENYSTLLWSSAGDGSFDDPNLLNALYTPGSGDISTGSVWLYLSSDGLSSACYPHTDSMLLSIQYLPEVFAGDDHRICSNEDIHLEAEMWYAAGSQWFSSGDGVFDDPNNLHNVYHPGDGDLAQGYVDLWLSVEGEAPCQASATDSMRVEFEPYLHANAGSDQSVCANESVQLYGGPVNADNSLWTTAGDGSFNAPNNLWTQYTPGFNDISAGGVELYLTVFDADGYCPPNQDTTFISISALPTTGFQASEECLGNATQFTDISSGAEISEWYWDFGDGNSSTEQNPEHQYAAAGSYNVSLNITTTEGCNGSAANETNVLPLPEFSFSFNSVCSGQPTNFQSDITGVPQARLWKFGDGETSGESHPLHQYPAAGTYECWLIVTAAGGCTDSLMQLVTVKESPVAQFDFSASCLNQPVSFTDLSQSTLPIASRNWDFGDGTVSSGQNPEHVYQQSGTYTVTLDITNEDGCSDSYSQNIEIVPLPVAEFSFSHACAGRITTFTDLSSSTGSSIDTWLWDFGDGTTSGQQYPQHVFLDAGSYNVQLTVSNEENCTHSKSIDLLVSNSPQLFLGNDTSLCPGDMLTLDAGTHASYLWQDGSTLPYLTVYGPGTYWVEVSNTAGCSTRDSIIIFNEPGIDISGIVSIEGEAVANALVKIHAYAPDHLSPAFDSVYTDENGFYMLEDVSPCLQYLISAQSEEIENSFRTWYEQAAYWNYATMVDTSLGMSGSGLENIDIDLLTFYNGGTGDATLCGNVSYDIHGKHPLGEPIKNVDISLELLGTEKADSIPWHIIKRTKTNDLGDYCFTEVNGGDYRIVVDLPCLPMDSMYYLNIYNADTSIYDLDYIVDSTGIYIVTTGMEDIYGSEHYGRLSLWPNPSQGDFEIRFESNQKGRKVKQIQILDMNGKLILNETINTRLSDVFQRKYYLPSSRKGVFILRFICDDFVLHKRFIVK